MKKSATPHTSQDYDRKHGQNHISNNPRAKKDIPTTEDDDTTKPAFSEDKRKTSRQEHTNHFTNRVKPENQ